MIANFTNPINFTLNANLVEPSQQWWSSLIANLLPIIVVLIGAYTTYHYSRQQEDKRNRHELKKMVYFEALDLIHKLDLYSKKIDYLKGKVQTDEVIKETISEDKKFRDTSGLIARIQPKIEVVGNEDVYNAFNDLLLYVVDDAYSDNRTTLTLEERANFTKKRMKLTQAIRIDLMGDKRLNFDKTAKFGNYPNLIKILKNDKTPENPPNDPENDRQ
jgi:hypothetical protein